MAKAEQKTQQSRLAEGSKRPKQATTARRKAGPTVTWVEVGHIGRKGHGVEFSHAARPETVLAFINGFEWMHKPDTAARVEILRAHATRFSPAVRSLVRRKVLSVFKQRGKTNWLGSRGQIRLVVNG
jgi:hypothetical protein